MTAPDALTPDESAAFDVIADELEHSEIEQLALAISVEVLRAVGEIARHKPLALTADQVELANRCAIAWTHNFLARHGIGRDGRRIRE